MSDAAQQYVGSVDVSHWQGAVGFQKLRNSGQEFTFIKATHGGSEQDPTYPRNVAGARAAGLLVGSYRYFTSDSPQAKWENFSMNASLFGDLPPMVDIELMPGAQTPPNAVNLQPFLTLVQSKYGVKPILYSNAAFANQHLAGFEGYPLWVAEYNNDKAPLLPKGWNRWLFWQYSDSGPVPGVNGAIDLPRFDGSRRIEQAARCCAAA